MSLSPVNAGTWSSLTSESEVQYDAYPGGVYMVQADSNACNSGQTFYVKLYSRVSPGSPLSLYKQSSPTTPVDPVIVQLGPIITTELADFRLQFTGTTGLSIPWRLYQIGRCSSLNAGTWTESGTETILATYQYPGTFILIADVSQIGGDTVIGRAYVRCGSGSGGTARAVQKVSMTFVGGSPVIFEVGPVPTSDYVQFTLQRTSGAGTAGVYWKTFKLGT